MTSAYVPVGSTNESTSPTSASTQSLRHKPGRLRFVPRRLMAGDGGAGRERSPANTENEGDGRNAGGDRDAFIRRPPYSQWRLHLGHHRGSGSRRTSVFRAAFRSSIRAGHSARLVRSPFPPLDGPPRHEAAPQLHGAVISTVLHDDILDSAATRTFAGPGGSSAVCYESVQFRETVTIRAAAVAGALHQVDRVQADRTQSEPL